jgi:elongation factor Ts
VVIGVNSETDFVARNEQFQTLVNQIADTALTTSADLDVIKAANLGNYTVADTIASAIATIGENITLRRAAGLAVGQGVVTGYVHNPAGKIGVIVALESAGKTDELSALGRLVAMHVAAANPRALDASGVNPAVVAREREVIAEKAKAQGKPPDVVKEIVESGLKTFYKEICLVDQDYVHDLAKSVAQAVKEAEAKAGGAIRIASYVRLELGEGIERPDGDSAAMAGSK